MVLKLRCTPAKAAILSDLGWLPVCDTLDNLRVACFLHVRFKMDSQRLPALLLKQIMSSNCNYYKDIKEILNKCCLDFVYTDVDLNPKTVIKSFKSFGRQLYHLSPKHLQKVHSNSTIQIKRLLPLDTYMILVTS